MKSAVRLILFFILLCSPGLSFGQVDTASLRAAFVAKFLPFIQWPNGQAPEVLRVLVFGDDGHASDRLKDAFANSGQKIEIFKNGGKEKPHIVLFLGANADLRKKTASQYSEALLISHSVGALQDGFLINFYEQDDRLKFEINLGATKARGFQFSSQLLKLARVVEATP